MKVRNWELKTLKQREKNSKLVTYTRFRIISFVYLFSSFVH